MIEFYFSGATEVNAVQRISAKSLGGFISSSKIPNSQLDVLFDTVSYRARKQGLIETKAIFVKNNSNAETISSLKLDIVEDLQPQGRFSIAVVSAVGDIEIEKISSIRDVPYNATFQRFITKRAKAVMKVLSSPIVGESISIMGNDLPPIEEPTIEDLIQKTLQAFNSISDFSAQRTGIDEVTFQRIILEDYLLPLSFVTDGQATIQSVNFGGYSANQATLINDFTPNKTFGLWIQRQIIPLGNQTDVQLQAYVDGLNGGWVQKQELVDFVFSY